MRQTSLVVIGAGPYGMATAAYAKEREIDTVVVGRPMELWTQHMPAGVCLRSGPDWHLDAAGTHTFEAFMEDRGITPGEVDPIPISVFLEYAGWFQRQKHLQVCDELVTKLVKAGERFEVVLEGGEVIRADAVVATPGLRPFRQLPDWAASLPEGVGAHSCEWVNFEGAAGQRVLVVGGRQSAYEWAALLGEAGAERVDVVHRHPVPRFERVSWRFVDPYLEATLALPGWWRHLPESEREAIARRFWEVGRLTLEWWLPPRLRGDRFRRWPETSVSDVAADGHGPLEVTLSNGEVLRVDRVLFATGYRANLEEVSYLGEMAHSLALLDGFPRLDEWFQSAVAGLYLTGFVATRDFGPFFGFTKGCPAAATLIVDHLLNQSWPGAPRAAQEGVS